MGCKLNKRKTGTTPPVSFPLAVDVLSPFHQCQKWDWHGPPGDPKFPEGPDDGAEIPAGAAFGRLPHHSGDRVWPLQLAGGYLWPPKHSVWGRLLQGKISKESNRSSRGTFTVAVDWFPSIPHGPCHFFWFIFVLPSCRRRRHWC